MIIKRQNFFLILFGLIIIPLLFELILWTTGYIYYSFRIKNEASHLTDRDAIRILCLGDSFTFGEGAPKGYSYPEQLQRMLDNNSSNKFIVYNAAMPGSNSSQLFKNLENNIQRYSPDVIIVMTGCNNNFNFEQSNYFLFADKSIKANLYHLDAFLTHMRSYKLLKIALINLSNKIKPKIRLKLSSPIHNNEIFKNHSDKVNKYRVNKVSQELVEEMEKSLELGKAYLSQAKINLATAEFKKAIEPNPYDVRPYHMLGFIYLHRSPDLKDKHELAIQAFKKVIEINPFDEYAHSQLYEAYHRSGKMNLALEELKIIHQLNPTHEWVRQLLIHGIPNIEDEDIEKSLKYDLQNIIALILSKGIKLILQNYPQNGLNETLRQMAEVNKLPFVDNESAFKKLASSVEYKKQDYFAEDDHCNVNGYGVIAKNVYRVLKSELKELLE